MPTLVDWVDWARSHITQLASLATVVGVPVALLAYAGNARATRLAHMHRLFADYLRMSFDYFALSQVNPEARDELASFRMYSMEEMLLWIKRERRFQWLHAPFWTSARDDALLCWEATIESHLTSRVDPISDAPRSTPDGSVPIELETAQNLNNYWSCYTDDFKIMALGIPPVRRALEELSGGPEKIDRIPRCYRGAPMSG